LVKRNARNHIIWLGPPIHRTSENGEEKAVVDTSGAVSQKDIDAEVAALRNDEQRVDAELRKLQLKVKQLHGEKQRHCFVTHGDLRSVFPDDSAILAVRFPPRTLLDTPQPTGTASSAHHFLYLRHSSDPISVYVVADAEEEASGLKRASRTASHGDSGSGVHGGEEEEAVLDSSNSLAPLAAAYTDDESRSGLLSPPLASEEYYLSAFDGPNAALSDLYSPLQSQ